jgi:hypothetical protein
LKDWWCLWRTHVGDPMFWILQFDHWGEVSTQYMFGIDCDSFYVVDPISDKGEENSSFFFAFCFLNRYL